MNEFQVGDLVMIPDRRIKWDGDESSGDYRDFFGFVMGANNDGVHVTDTIIVNWTTKIDGEPGSRLELMTGVHASNIRLVLGGALTLFRCLDRQISV